MKSIVGRSTQTKIIQESYKLIQNPRNLSSSTPCQSTRALSRVPSRCCCEGFCAQLDASTNGFLRLGRWFKCHKQNGTRATPPRGFQGVNPSTVCLRSFTMLFYFIDILPSKHSEFLDFHMEAGWRPSFPCGSCAAPGLGLTATCFI